MPSKTNTDVLRDLTANHAALSERADALRRDLGSLELTHSRTMDALTKAVTQLAVLEEKVARLEKAGDQRESRHWAVTLAVIGSVLTLVVNIVLLWLHK